MIFSLYFIKLAQTLINACFSCIPKKLNELISRMASLPILMPLTQQTLRIEPKMLSLSFPRTSRPQ